VLAVAPVWLATAVACLAIWPRRQNAAHLVVLGLVGMIVADICLLGFRKIAFTCSYLPGRSRFNIVFLGAFGVLWLGSEAVIFERHALRHTGSMALMLALLAVAWVTVRRTAVTLARGEEQELRFEEEQSPAVLGLGLHRDGVMPIGP